MQLTYNCICPSLLRSIPLRATKLPISYYEKFYNENYRSHPLKAYFLDATVGFGNSRNQFVENNETQIIDNSLLSIGVGPGFTIFASDGIALEALVKYNFAKSDSQINVGEISRTSVTWTNALDFSVGIRYYFGGVRPTAAAQPAKPLNSGSLYR